MEYLLSTLIAIIIMVCFALFVIKNIIKKMNENTKKYFMDKLQDYDYIIDEKKKEIEELTGKINNLKEEIEISKEIEEYKKHKAEIKPVEIQKHKEEKQEIIYDIPTPQYRQEQFFTTYKKLKKQFDVDSKKILQEFIQEHTNAKEDEEYKKLQKIKKYFDEETIYQCLTLTPEEQYEIVEKTVNNQEEKIIGLKDYDKKSFSILKMIEKIDEKIKETDPTIYVYVGSEETNYDNLGSQIKTKFYPNMSEGIIIKYHNKMYDYSI